MGKMEEDLKMNCIKLYLENLKLAFFILIVRKYNIIM